MKKCNVVVCCWLFSYVAQVFAQEPAPYTHQNFPSSQEFSFAITSDLTGGYREGVFDVAVAQLNLLRPKLVMSVGDLIEGPALVKEGKGIPNPQSTEQQWQVFDGMVNRLDMPFYHVPGNHDIYSMEAKRVWQARYGQPYYHFVYENCLFLVINGEDYTDDELTLFSNNMEELLAHGETEEYKAASEKYFKALQAKPFVYKRPESRFAASGSSAISEQQRDYITATLNDNADVRWTFVFMHKPLWLNGGGDEWKQVEAQLQNRNYTAFAGHHHTYKYEENNGKAHIRLATTGGGMGPNGFDHFMWVTMTEEGPEFANILLDGVLDVKGNIPAGGDKLTFRPE